MIAMRGSGASKAACTWQVGNMTQGEFLLTEVSLRPIKAFAFISYTAIALHVAFLGYSDQFTDSPRVLGDLRSEALVFCK